MRTMKRGFTLIEVAVALAVVAVLATIAVPSYRSQVRKARRADALASLLAIQQAQELWRSTHASYAQALGEGGLNLPESSPGGHFTLTTTTASDSRGFAYSVMATANVTDTSDICRVMRLDMLRGRFVNRSGPDADVTNGPADNRRCWGL